MAYTTNQFLDAHRKLEEWANTNYDLDKIEELEHVGLPPRINRELNYFRSIRNVLTHNPNDVETPLILLTDEFEKRFAALCKRLMEPETVMDIAILASKIYKPILSDFVMPTIQHMHQKNYTHVPVMMNKKVWGVFSENTLFELANENKLSIVDDKLQFFNLDCCRISKENHGVYDFIPRSKTIDDVTAMFKEAINNTSRLDILFITDTGNSDGNLLGLITAWDIAGL